MDKNTIIGFVLIFGIIVGFSWFNRPTEEQIAEQKRYRDSVALIEFEKAQQKAILEELEKQKQTNEYSFDSLTIESAKNVFGEFASSAIGEEQFFSLENEKLKVTFSSKGGRVCEVELKQFKTFDSLPLILFSEDESEMNFTFLTANNRVINTQNFFFEPIFSQTDKAKLLTMRLSAGEESYLDFVYELKNDDYQVDFSIRPYNMESVLANINSIEMFWQSKLKQQEKGRKFESRYATLSYKFSADDVENLSEMKDDSKKLSNRVKWIAFKDQFFSSILIANNDFISTSVESKIEGENSGYLKNYKAETTVDFDPTGLKSTDFTFLFVPNKYKTLSEFDEQFKGVFGENFQLKNLIPLGWTLFRWVNQYLIIPVFNFLEKYISNYGIIILLLTIFIKLIIFPFTYKSYISSAKMRVLKPQIDEINAKIPADKPMERQQATMKLYQRVGVSPMSGCLPMLFQMPILFAMFTFFPASIELRQQSFLWAQDLSSYDAIVSWDAYIPLITPYFGNHISLFCLLMTITNIIYTKINMSSQAGAADQMKMMKWMMYLMPLMFLFIFNDYASGLSYYYFISLLITIAQTYLIRLFVDEKKLLKKLEENKKKPVKKSGFMARLEEAQRQQQKAMREQMKKKK